jgi:4-amino-4-deoxy-L-arabinose transferase-like glycosyltransferase
VAGLGLAVALASLSVFVHGWYDPNPDAAMYVSTARALVRGAGYTYLGEPFQARPPGFALLLAPVVGIADANFFALNLTVSLLGVAALVLLYRYERERVGWRLALLVAAVLWLNPGFRRLSCQVLSDVPALAALYACLLLERRTDRSSTPWRETALGVAIGAAGLLRTALALLVLAVLAARIARRLAGRDESGPWAGFALRRLAPPLLGTALVLLPWSFRNAALPALAADQTLVSTHWVAQWREDPGDPSSRRLSAREILERVPLRAGQIARGLGERLTQTREDVEGPLTPLAAAGAVVLTAGLVVVAAARPAAAEFFALGMLGVLSVYFGFGTRLLLPVYPLALAATVRAMRAAVSRAGGARSAEALPAAVLVLVAALDFRPHDDWGQIRAIHERLQERAAAIASSVDPQARLASGHGFRYALFLDRPVWSLSFATERAGDPAAAEELIERYAIDSVVLAPGDRADRPLLRYFSARHPPARPVADALLFSVSRAPPRGEPTRPR